MSENLVELARRFVHLSGELDATRDAMKRLLMNDRGPKRKPYAGQAARREAAAVQSPKGASGAASRRDDPQTPAIVAGLANDGDRQGDDGGEIDDGRAAKAPSGEGPGRARRRRRRMASAGLTAEEIADLLEPGPATQCEPWIKPLSCAKRHRRAPRLKSEGGHGIAQRRAHRPRHPAAGQRPGLGDLRRA